MIFRLMGTPDRQLEEHLPRRVFYKVVISRRHSRVAGISAFGGVRRTVSHGQDNAEFWFTAQHARETLGRFFLCVAK
jgi:hypothetical protein